MKWILATIVLAIVLWYGAIFSGFEPWKLVGFEMGTGIVARNAPDEVVIGQPIRIVFAASVPGGKIAGRFKNVVLYYHPVGETDYRPRQLLEHNLINNKHENFVFIIQPQSKAGVVNFYFEYVFDNKARKIEGGKQIIVRTPTGYIG